MAPEMSADESTTKVDVFSFAIILDEIFVGKKAFSDSLSRRQVIQRILQGKRGEIPGTVLPFTKSLIEKCRADEAGKRPSFQEILDELRQNRSQIIDGVDSDEVERFWIANVNKQSPADSLRGSRSFVLPFLTPAPAPVPVPTPSASLWLLIPVCSLGFITNL
jgi:serine/threonine protein kinase